MPHTHRTPFWVVATASSAGGLHALRLVLGGLPGDFPAAVLVVQHLPVSRNSVLAQILDRGCALPVHYGAAGTAVHPGHVYVAPAGRHLALEPDYSLSLSDTPPVHGVRPSADVLFESIGRVCGTRGVAVVLTGLDGDGSGCCGGVRRAGGTVIAQDPATAKYPGMPRSAIDAGCVSRVVPLAGIAGVLESLVAG